MMKLTINSKLIKCPENLATCKQVIQTLQQCHRGTWVALESIDHSTTKVRPEPSQACRYTNVSGHSYEIVFICSSIILLATCGLNLEKNYTILFFLYRLTFLKFYILAFSILN